MNTGPEGNRVRQALAAGLPILAHPSYAPLLREDVTGLLALPEQPGAWTELLRRAASSPEGRRRWGEGARALAEEELAWPRIAERFERLCLDARAALAAILAPKGIELGGVPDGAVEDSC